MLKLLKGKTILLGVTGGIAAYKSAYLTSLLVKAGADVQVIMTEHAQEFITPLTFESLISTLDEVMQIQQEGRTKRREAEQEIQRLEGELKAKLLEIRR